MKISTKYSLMTAALIGAVVAAVAASVISAQRSALEAESRMRLEAVMDGVERLAAESVEARDDLMLVSYIMFLKKSRPELSYAAVTRKGHTSRIGAESPGLLTLDRTVAARRPVTYTVTAYPTTADPAQNLSVSSSGVSLNIPGDASVKIDEPEKPEFTTVTVGFLRERLQAELDRALKPLIQKTIILAGVFMGLGWVGALGLGKLLTAPLTALTAAVGQVEHGKLDVTVEAKRNDEIGALAGRFNAMTQHIRELVEFRQDILHTLTHEMNTPLTGLKGYLELWQDDKLSKDPAAQKETAQTMLAAVLRMENSLSSALGLFKSESLTTNLPRSVVWLDELFTEAASLYAPLALSKSITVRLPSREVLPFLFAPAEIVRQIIFNLLSNAIKYTPENGEVKIGLSENALEATLWISDTGHGIKPEDIPLIFTKFYRAGPEGMSRIPGTGLGLSIAKKAVESLGGKIRVESELGKGSTFFVALPKNPPEKKL